MALVLDADGLFLFFTFLEFMLFSVFLRLLFSFSEARLFL